MHVIDTHLILHDCIADVLNESTKFIGVYDVVKEALDPPLLGQHVYLSMSIS